MRKLFLVALCAIAVAGLVFFYAAPSMAVHKNPGNQLVCGGCHTMHNSQGNSSLGGNTDGSLILLRGAVTTRADVHMLCLQCHASNGAQNTTEFPDEDAIGDGNHPAPKVFIMGAGGYGNGTDLEDFKDIGAGGDFSATLSSAWAPTGGDASNAVGNGHSIGYALAIPPGNDTSNAVI